MTAEVKAATHKLTHPSHPNPYWVWLVIIWKLLQRNYCPQIPMVVNGPTGRCKPFLVVVVAAVPVSLIGDILLPDIQLIKYISSRKRES